MSGGNGSSKRSVVRERRLRILELLHERGELTIAALSRDFGVSEMTVRRDLDALKRERAIKRTHGRAISVVSRSYEPPFTLRASRNSDVKVRLAEAAASMVSEGEIVVLDVGTTALRIAEALVTRTNITVVTTNLRAAWLLTDNPDLRVILTGGVLRSGERSLVGAYSERMLEELYCDTFFMGAGGIDVAAGFTEYNLEEARIKQIALRNAKRCVVVADSSKLGRVALVKVARIDEVDELLTDADIEPEKRDRLRRAGLKILAL